MEPTHLPTTITLNRKNLRAGLFVFSAANYAHDQLYGGRRGLADPIGLEAATAGNNGGQKLLIYKKINQLRDLACLSSRCCNTLADARSAVGGHGQVVAVRQTENQRLRS